MERTEFFNGVEKELNERGYTTRQVKVFKNGVARDGLCIGEGEIRPNIYFDDFYNAGLSISETADKITEFVDMNTLSDETKDKALSFIKDKDFCLERVRIDCSKANTYTDCINRQENGITLSMVIDLTGIIDYATCRVKPEMLENWNISEEELWERAKANSEKDVVIKSMFETLTVLMDGEEPPFDDSNNPPVLVVTNKSMSHGAYAVFTETAKAEIKRRMKTDEVIILPSSIHETIVVPYKDENGMEEVTNMVREVNATQVADEDVLSDTPFRMAI